MVLDKKTLKKIFIGVAACIILYWILHETERAKVIWDTASAVLAPFVLGAGLAFILNVPMRSFENMLSKIKNPGLRRTIAVLLTFIAVILVLTVVFLLLIPQVIATVETLIPQLIEFANNVGLKVNGFLNDNPELMKWIVDNTDLENMNWGSIIQQALAVVGNSVSVIVSGAFSAIGSITGALVNLVIGIVFALYCLFGKETLARQGRRLLYAFFPEKFGDETIRILRLANSTFSNFLSGQCIEVCILGCLFAVAMAIFQMPYIPLVSMLVAVTAFIPVVGAFVGCGLGAFFIFVDNPVQAVFFVVLFLVLQQIENNMIYPRVVGTSIGLPGMWVLFAVSVGGELMGVAGMFLMIPMASVLYTLLREFTAKRLDKKEIDPDKLQTHPPELRSHFSEKRRKKREKQVKLKKSNKEDTGNQEA